MLNSKVDSTVIAQRLRLRENDATPWDGLRLRKVLLAVFSCLSRLRRSALKFLQRNLKLFGHIYISPFKTSMHVLCYQSPL
jgi:hypothetical protein